MSLIFWRFSLTFRLHYAFFLFILYDVQEFHERKIRNERNLVNKKRWTLFTVQQKSALSLGQMRPLKAWNLIQCSTLLRLLKENSRKKFFIRGDLTSTSFITMNCIFITLKVNAKRVKFCFFVITRQPVQRHLITFFVI